MKISIIFIITLSIPFFVYQYIKRYLYVKVIKVNFQRFNITNINKSKGNNV